MEAATPPERTLDGEKAQRIVDAMRTSVGARGAAGATFDVVAREAGVSRGLLHYYFGTKERLLAEVVRRDCDLRMERLSATTAGAASPGELLGSMAIALREMLDESPEFLAILLELHTLGRTNPEVAAELRELHRRVRVHLGRHPRRGPRRRRRHARRGARGRRGGPLLARRRARHAHARRAGARLRADAHRGADRRRRARALIRVPGPGSGDGEGSPR